MPSPSPLTVYLAAVEARTEAATPGPWVMDQGRKVMTPPGIFRQIVAETKFDAPALEAPALVSSWDNAIFIAHARTDLPRLVRLLQRAVQAITIISDLEGHIDPRELGHVARAALTDLDRLATEEEGR